VRRIFDRVWREGFGWRKAGVLLLELGLPGAAPASLFDALEAPDDRLMSAIDQINARYGRGSARLGLAQKDSEWRMRRENLSPSFTTRWTDIPSASLA
jgi:DNA polymerase V